MSTPTTHDPRFVNTRDGVCWERRAVTDGGLGLYAVEGSCKCPEFKMATFVELAAHGIVEWADVLPMPVGPVPQLSELERMRLRVDEVERAYTFDTAALKRRIAELEAGIAWRDAERARWSGVRYLVEKAIDKGWSSVDRFDLEDALGPEVAPVLAESVAEPSCLCPPADQPGPHQFGCPLAEVPRLSVDESADKLSRFFSPVAAYREDPHDSPLHHDYKGPGRDFPELGGTS